MKASCLSLRQPLLAIVAPICCLLPTVVGCHVASTHDGTSHMPTPLPAMISLNWLDCEAQNHRSGDDLPESEQQSRSSKKGMSFCWFLCSLSGFFKTFLSKKERVPFFSEGQKGILKEFLGFLQECTI